MKITFLWNDDCNGLFFYFCKTGDKLFLSIYYSEWNCFIKIIENFQTIFHKSIIHINPFPYSFSPMNRIFQNFFISLDGKSRIVCTSQYLNITFNFIVAFLLLFTNKKTHSVAKLKFILFVGKMHHLKAAINKITSEINCINIHHSLHCTLYF